CAATGRRRREPAALLGARRLVGADPLRRAGELHGLGAPAVSIPVPLPELASTMSRFGSVPYLLTVGPDATPHAASVTVEWSPPEAPDDVGNLLVGAGRRTAANIRANEALALLWPPPSPGDYSLIVDGTGSI